MAELVIAHVPSRNCAEKYLQRGFCLVESSHESVCCDLNIGSPGTKFILQSPSVAERAYRGHFGLRGHRPWFVAIGPPRIDAIACILSLAGYLPRPERLEDFKDAEPAVRDAMTRDLTPMVRLADRVELEPGITLESTRETRPVIAWKIAMVNPRPEWLAYSMGVRFLLGQTGQPFAFVMLAQHAAETGIAAATEVMVVEYVSDVVAVVDSIVWDFALWHPDLAPVIVVYNAKEGRAVVNCSRGSMTATDFFGDGGLRTVLWEVGWEGREEAGGSPLDARLSREEILDAARKIASRAKKN